MFVTEFRSNFISMASSSPGNVISFTSLYFFAVNASVFDSSKPSSGFSGSASATATASLLPPSCYSLSCGASLYGFSYWVTPPSALSLVSILSKSGP